ncbi:MAG: baseplate J/gp47 family protein [Anaerolineales bacterium]|nr:baseplate J/gp47 family protein [Anaerolineales bacterium]
MIEEIITLTSEDELSYIRDRLAHVDADRVLLVLPTNNEPVNDRLSMMLVQRQAIRQNIELGLVTTNPGIMAEALHLGIPVFPSVEIGQSRTWRWPWKKQKEPSPVTPSAPPDSGDLKEMLRRTRPQPIWQSRLIRLAGVFIFVFVLVSLVISAIYIVPGATVIIHPITKDLNVTTLAVADPTVEESNYAQGIIPARVIRVEVSWTGSSATTGSTDVPDAAGTGTVYFINQQSKEPITVPAGTVVRTSAGTTVRFRTIKSVEVPGVASATAEAPIVAIDSGPMGNVDANMINQIEGALALQLQVRNLSPTTSGGVRQVKAVTQADLDRLRGQVLQQLFQLAKADMANWMTATEFLAEESLSLFLIQEEDYNRYVGEKADSVELEMTALIQGYAVDSSEGYGIVYTQLAAETPEGFQLIPESISKPRLGEIIQVNGDGQITFLMQGSARVAAIVNQNIIAEQLHGQKISDAIAWINKEIPVETAPTIDVWPNWFGRLPYLTVRINTLVETVDQTAGS